MDPRAHGHRAAALRGAGRDDLGMGARAARRALAMAGREASEVDAVIVATSTPDLTFPSAATMVQKAWA
jgi:3-oxoacyl-[acyl-carrier-protein] synthase-3